MSDWGADHSTSIMQGLDQEMPGASYMGPDMITAGISAGSITQAAVDQSVLNMLLPMFAVGLFDQPAGERRRGLGQRRWLPVPTQHLGI